MSSSSYRKFTKPVYIRSFYIISRVPEPKVCFQASFCWSTGFFVIIFFFVIFKFCSSWFISRASAFTLEFDYNNYSHRKLMSFSNYSNILPTDMLTFFPLKRFSWHRDFCAFWTLFILWIWVLFTSSSECRIFFFTKQANNLARFRLNTLTCPR